MIGIGTHYANDGCVPPHEDPTGHDWVGDHCPGNGSAEAVRAAPDRTGPGGGEETGGTVETDSGPQGHRPTGLANMFGGYDCVCGEPWLTLADRCMTQPDLAEHGFGAT